MGMDFKEFIWAFQFTPLREGRQEADFAQTSKGNFNSRPCVRGDASDGGVIVWQAISIHAPA